VSLLVAQKRTRLQTIVAERALWTDQVAQIKRLHGWLLEVEHLLDESLVPKGDVVSHAMVGSRLESWRERMAAQVTDGSLSELERECLSELLRVLSTVRPSVGQCFDREDVPRTNHEMERSIRGLKTPYRRVSGRKDGNASLVRYGRCVAYAAWWEHDAAHRTLLEQHVARLDRVRWRALRRETTVAPHEHLTRVRFRQKRQPLLAFLEEHWAVATQSVSLP
jgi:hypothetical protein